ncbi:MAG: hypothetical protein JSW00_14350 [Thermoplasmata archaeon]|nr:MAG: hypothetical protein JSW00_14350 [Thermoplasmata archaeon]
MVKIKEKERAIIEFTCIPEVTIEKAQELYDIGFKHLRELLEFSLDEEAKVRGLVEILNFRILNQFLSMDADDIPAHKFKCPLCMGTVYGDEEECGDCGALLLEEILEVEIEDVYSGLRERIDTVIANPEGAKKFLAELSEGDKTAEVMEILTKEVGEEATMDWGFIATSITPNEKGENLVLVISPLGDRQKESEKVLEDLKEFGTLDSERYPLEGGNITNKQEEAIKDVVLKLTGEQNFTDQAINRLNVLNLKIAGFLESKATVIIEDNRHFLSSIDEIGPDDEKIESIKKMVYEVGLIKEIRKIGENFILDGISFNNDPVSFFLAKECIPILRNNPDLDIRILDVVVNTNYIDQGYHTELVHLLKEWKK